MSDPSTETIRTFLRLGFPLHSDEAQGHLERLLLPATDMSLQSGRGMTDILEEIVEGLVAQSGAAHVAIPLSAGNDSRALLGAALRVLGRERIRCMTFGRADHPDVIGAQTVARAVGVEWSWIDPRLISWDLEPLLKAMAASRNRFGGVCSQAVARIAHIDAMLEDDTLVLSGYLGDVLAGNNVPRAGLSMDQELNRFLIKNLTLLDLVSFDVGAARTELEMFLRSNLDFQRAFRTLTIFDILDFGFRQPLRLRSTVGAYRNAAFPFEHPVWVRYWLDQPLERRLGKRFYRSELVGNYKHVFILPHDLGKPRKTLRARLGDLRRQLRLGFRRVTKDPEDSSSFEALARRTIAQGRRPGKMDYRDFEENESARQTYRTLLNGLDARGILPEGTFATALDRFAEKPTQGHLDYITQGARVEAHLRIGSIPAGPPHPPSRPSASG